MISQEERKLIVRMCGDIGDSLYPFRDIAQELGMEEYELLELMRSYKERGMLRRFGAVLRHQDAGYKANGMSIWNIPDADVERVGEQMTRYKEISHCYERHRLSAWPYNIYAMIHGHTKEEVLATARSVSEKVGIDDYDVLFSVREFKKTSMIYDLT